MTQFNVPSQRIIDFTQQQGFEVINNALNVNIVSPRALSAATSGHISFCKMEGEPALLAIAESKASMLVCHHSIAEQPFEFADDCVYLLVDNPRQFFIQLTNQFFIPPAPPAGIHPTAHVHPQAEIAASTTIGPHAVIGQCKIGERCHIHAGVVLYDNVEIGDDVCIHSGTVIGADGFGYDRDTDGNPTKFYHYGGVKIHDHVEIGSNTSIDRGTLADTVIGPNAKIDNLVHIAHNVQIEEGVFVIANSMIAGSVRLGKACWIAPSAAIKNGLSVGAGALVGLGAVALKDVAADDVVAGVPARSLKW